MAARVDVTRRAMSASLMTNWTPDELGPMSLRPGLKMIKALGTGITDGTVKILPFVVDLDNQFNILVGVGNAGVLDIEYYDSVGGTYEYVGSDNVSTAVTNGDFSTLTGWTDADEGGTAASSLVSSDFLQLLGDGTNAAKRTQTLTISGADEGALHILYVKVERGPVRIRLGSSASGDQYINEVELGTGEHTLEFTPAAGSAYLQVLSRLEYPVLVDEINIHAGGTYSFVNPFIGIDPALLRWDQSADVMYVAAYGNQQRVIKHRDTNSWSIEYFEPTDGPFRTMNLTDATITASALTGSATLTASIPLFKSTHVGALFRLESNGQVATQSVSAQNTFTDPVLVTGTGGARALGVVVTGTFSATVTLQRSVGAIGSWVDVTTYSTTQSTTLTDNLDNQTIYYRLGVKTGGYTSGTAVCTLNYSGGSITGVGRITAVSSSTVATAVVLKDFGGTSATTKWSEGAWSDYRGFPSACRLKDGRLFFVGKDTIYASAVDDYYSFTPDYVGDASPFTRSIGSGAVDKARWLHDNGSLIMGAVNRLYRGWASSQEEPMTPTQFSFRPIKRRGAANIDAVMYDDNVIFLDISGTRLLMLSPNGAIQDLTQFNPEILSAGVVELAIQFSPVTRVHCLLSDGTVAVLLFNGAEEIAAWYTVELADTNSTAGLVQSMSVLPGTEEDEVYYLTKRNIGGTSQYFLEKFALASDCIGGTQNHQLDCFFVYNSTPTTTPGPTGLSVLNGETVGCWADGVWQGTFVVSAGAITLTSSVSEAVIGPVYQADFTSTKLAAEPQDLVRKKRGYALGLVLADTHARGLQYGTDASYLDDLPLIEAETTIDTDGIWSDYNYQVVDFNGEYSVDSRLYLRAPGGRPVTVLAAVLNMEKETK